MEPIIIQRVYDHAPARGTVFLVDRVWPRGVRKEDLRIDGWLRDVAPSNELRQWFGHRPERFAEFAERYRAELAEHPEVLQPLRTAAEKGPVTLLYSAKDPDHNQAVVLRDHLEHVRQR
ncbi:DUF488 family protein [Nonomuraea sp. K274]|uniref:DUF488 family protein n=1 Tax=Nonomuraea cypriaca TaxID=1187855 RepID=A0A931AGK3_9ACTN|nr:DUF488 family protein [Nonomuraea cypriaca]MBF8192451.1 DUF488 family protein [Nonomuraea cypriaca]